MQQLVGKFSGIVQNVFEVVTSESEVDFFAYGARLCDTRQFALEESIGKSAGAGWNREDALTRCLGEASERYAAAIYNPKDFIIGEPSDNAILPEDIYPFSAEQKADAEFPFAQSGHLSWKKGIDLRTGKARYAPAFCVYMPFTPRDGDCVYGPSMSTGLAAGPNLEWALTSALLEVVERDVFTNWWLSEGKASLTDGVLNLHNDFGIPVAAKLIDRDVISVGVSAGRTWTEAADKATLEALLGQSYVRALVRRSPSPASTADFADHARFYTDHPEHRSFLKKMFNPDTVTAANLNSVDPLQALLKNGFDPWYCDITPVDIKSLGLTVVRALVPGLTPLHASERWAFLGSKRLGTVANHLPHPLP